MVEIGVYSTVGASEPELPKFRGVSAKNAAMVWWKSAATAVERAKNCAERCSEDGGVLRFLKILAHNRRKFWYNTQRTPRWVDNRPLSFGNAVQGSDRKVWGPCLFPAKFSRTVAEKLVQYRYQPARFSLGGARSWPKGWGLSIFLSRAACLQLMERF